MARKKKTPTAVYETLAISLTSYSARIEAAINDEVRIPHHYHSAAKVFEFYSHLELTGTCTFPDERAGELYEVDVYGQETRHKEFELTLKDCHVRKEDGSYTYRKVRGKDNPVYEHRTRLMSGRIHIFCTARKPSTSWSSVFRSGLLSIKSSYVYY